MVTVLGVWARSEQNENGHPLDPNQFDPILRGHFSVAVVPQWRATTV